MKYTTDLNKRAWEIRKNAAVELGCDVLEVVWSECVSMACENECMSGTEPQINYAKDLISKAIDTLRKTIVFIAADNAEKKIVKNKAKLKEGKISQEKFDRSNSMASRSIDTAAIVVGVIDGLNNYNGEARFIIEALSCIQIDRVVVSDREFWEDKDGGVRFWKLFK